MIIQESEIGAYLGLVPEERASFLAASDPHFDVFDRDETRLILGKCSRLPDDEDLLQGRYGIDFHRALPPFKETSGYSCDLGDGPVAVNAYNYARYLPQTLRFREFTANLAFAARNRSEYVAKCRVYQGFYDSLYKSPSRVVIAAPHSGEVRRPPDHYHPFPQSEIDAWTARVGVRCFRRTPRLSQRFFVSLHSTDYFGSLLDIGDFGLPQNQSLSQVIGHLQDQFSETITALVPAYRDYILPYTRHRLKWFNKNFGTLDPERLTNVSTAARFELQSIAKVLQGSGIQKEDYSFDGLMQALETFWDHAALPLITLNGIFSGRKTARLLSLADNLPQADFQTGVQVECSRFLAQHYPDLAADLIAALLENMKPFFQP